VLITCGCPPIYLSEEVFQIESKDLDRLEKFLQVLDKRLKSELIAAKFEKIASFQESIRQFEMMLMRYPCKELIELKTAIIHAIETPTSQNVERIKELTYRVETMKNEEMKADLSKKLIGLGMALIAFPEPVMSNILGASLVTAGLVLKKKHSSDARSTHL
jgi:hypothetical protein